MERLCERCKVDKEAVRNGRTLDEGSSSDHGSPCIERSFYEDGIKFEPVSLAQHHME